LERGYNGCTKDKTDEEILLLNRNHRRYNRKKKRDIGLHCKNSNPIFKIALLDIYDKKEREAVEAQYRLYKKYNIAPSTFYKRLKME